MSAPPDKSKERCPIRGRYCSEHGFVHGHEAEALRSGIENLMVTKSEPTRDHGFAVNVVDLQKLLDSVDARDSLAFVEARQKRRRRA